MSKILKIVIKFKKLVQNFQKTNGPNSAFAVFYEGFSQRTLIDSIKKEREREEKLVFFFFFF